ncbi:hypothetical protein BgiBS90_013077, partial [Biomphalaria glabrata]
MAQETRLRDLETDTKQMGKTCGQLEKLALNRGSWRKLFAVGGLCPRRYHRQKGREM